MKTLLTGILAVWICTGCASSHQEEKPEENYPDLVTLNPPDDQPRAPSQVYIDSVKSITEKGRQFVVIHGSFPDGCTRLESAEHRIDGDTLEISLSAWRNPDMLCSQVLTPFTFIYNRFDSGVPGNRSAITINGTTYKLQGNG